MKLNLSKLILPVVCMLLLVSAYGAQGESKPKKKEIISALRLANDYFMKKWSDPGEEIQYPSRNKNYETNVWTRAVYYEGLMDLYSIDKQQRYIDYATDWGEFHKWDLRGGTNTRNADNQCAGQTYIMLYEMDPSKPERLEYIQKSIDMMMATDKIDDWSWIDAVQMAMPIFAQLSNVTGDPAYAERAHQMYLHTKNVEGGGLYNAEEQLWWRDADFVPPYKEPNGENCYWSRGNGWIVMAMVRMLQILPEDAPHRDEYQQMIIDMSHALAKVQREDGLWNVSLHDPDHFGGKELTGTAMFVQGMAYGVNNGFLDAKTFKPIIYKAWNGMVNDCLHSNGFLGYVQGTGKEPKEAQPVTYYREPDFDDYGLGAFLMAGVEVYKMK
ncbi:MAG: glycoside hydrolase family 88 protein [Rikenellaceae bacterium]|nr:glycoside hydrolase family 88 protein [Rikenellaceae bacterium]